jgi:hypothetical protein
MPEPTIDLADYNTNERYDEPAHDIATTIACEVTTDWGLDLADPMARVKTFAWVEKHAHENVRRALGEIPQNSLDWDAAAQAAGVPDATTAQTIWQPNPTT